MDGGREGVPDSSQRRARMQGFVPPPAAATSTSEPLVESPAGSPYTTASALNPVSHDIEAAPGIVSLTKNVEAIRSTPVPSRRQTAASEGRQTTVGTSRKGSTHNHHHQTHLHFHQNIKPEDIERILKSQHDPKAHFHKKLPVQEGEESYVCQSDEDDDFEYNFMGQITLGLRVYTQDVGAELQGQLRSSMNFSYSNYDFGTS
jgi:hypothetical protein